MLVLLSPAKELGPVGCMIVMAFAKHQRGALTRHIIQHRILDQEKLKDYIGDGYRFAADESTADEWVFLRDKR